MEQVAQGLRTNNAEQLEARSVNALQEDSHSQRVNPRNDEDERQRRQAQEKTTFQYNKQNQKPQQTTVATPEELAQATISRTRGSLDIMA